ncbi:MAG: competence/damage-inducible protein A, partial [Defluviicoccus sp.]|nr:competence/damage-inducible protein A [Defluviicoccus sp.]
MAEQGVVTACVLVIGNEILSGRTQDRNVNYLAKGLEALGIRLREVRMIPDDRATIVGAVNACRAAFDYVITTGGIGPTHDDITSECVAEAFGVGMYRDPKTVELIRSYLRSGEMNEARMRMATFPEGAELIANPVSAAPGYRIGNVFVLAGVPQIMQAMFDG